MVTYVLDTSVVARLADDAVYRRVTQIGTYNCRIPVMVLLEMGVIARDTKEYRRNHDMLTTMFTPVTASAWAQDHAVEVQALLVANGEHRSIKLPDLLIASIAQQLKATVLHYDRDFDTIARTTGQPVDWVVPPGSVS